MTSVDSRPRWFRGKLWFWLPIAPLVALDLWSKATVFAFLKQLDPNNLEMYRTYPVWSDEALVRFHFVAWRNTGTIWGLFQNATPVLIVLRSLALLMILWFAWRLPQRAHLQLLVLAMLFSGAVGNLWDNFTQPAGGVRDFLRFFTNSWEFPAFNVADSCICVGAFTLAGVLWFGDSQQVGQGVKPASSPPA